MNYSIEKATEKQMDFISEMYWSRTPKWQQNKYNYISFVAVDPMGNIIGYIVSEEKEIPVPPYGKDWFIVTITVLKHYRCCGIGSALLEYASTAAQKAGIRNLQGSANATIEAHSFWSKNKFCFLQYGKQHDDPAKAAEFGNYSHMIFRQVSDVNICCPEGKTRYCHKFDIANYIHIKLQRL